jgi:methionyl-tRNA formyltransferase
VATGKWAIAIQEIQGESGKRLPIDDFLCGCRLPDGTCLG